MNQKDTLQSKILSQIKAGKIKQKPKWQFALESLLFAIFLITLTFVLVYLTAFSDLLNHENDFQKLLDIPASRIDIMGIIQTLPLLIFFLLAVCFVILYILIRKYSLSYEKPAIYTLLGLLSLVVIINSAIRFFDPHRSFARIGDRDGIPFLMPLHDKYRDGRQGIAIHGIVKKISNDRLTVETYRSSSTIEIYIASTTKNSEVLNKIQSGDEIITFLEKSDSDFNNVKKAALIDLKRD